MNDQNISLLFCGLLCLCTCPLSLNLNLFVALGLGAVALVALLDAIVSLVEARLLELHARRAQGLGHGVEELERLVLIELGALLHGLLRALLDGVHEAHVELRDHGDGAAPTAGARRTAAAVHVVGRVARQVIVHDEVHARDVEAAARHVRGHEQLHLVRFEGAERGEAPLLAHRRMQRHARHLELRERLVHLRGCLAGVHKDDGALRQRQPRARPRIFFVVLLAADRSLCRLARGRHGQCGGGGVPIAVGPLFAQANALSRELVKHVHEIWELELIGQEGVLLHELRRHAARRRRAIEGRRFRHAEQLLRYVPNGVVHGRREEERLPLRRRWHGRCNRADVVGVVSRQQPVRLVEHERLGTAQERRRRAAQVISEAPRRRHDHMRPRRELQLLRHHVHAADDRRKPQPEVRTKRRELIGDLQRQLARRRENHGKHAVGFLAELVKQR
mmetsp:Transcript_32829/g.103935  ORF Transcript_32829/g.103935 Transcript_32829/m.103935 type:complete len:448 (+) Transcript_32829:1705-3048(+)